MWHFNFLKMFSFLKNVNKFWNTWEKLLNSWYVVPLNATTDTLSFTFTKCEISNHFIEVYFNPENLIFDNDYYFEISNIVPNVLINNISDKVGKISSRLLENWGYFSLFFINKHECLLLEQGVYSGILSYVRHRNLK